MAQFCPHWLHQTQPQVYLTQVHTQVDHTQAQVNHTQVPTLFTST